MQRHFLKKEAVRGNLWKENSLIMPGATIMDRKLRNSTQDHMR